MSIQGPDPVGEPGSYAEVYVLLEQAIKHLERSDLRSASVQLQRACDRVASLREVDGSSGPTSSEIPQVRQVGAGPVS